MRHNAGENVGRGFYWSPSTGEQVNVGDEQKVLPGQPGTVYYKLPFAVMVGLAPLLGVMFVMFLPAIGIALTLQQAGKAIGKQIGRWVHEAGAVAAPPEMVGQVALVPKEEEEETKPGKVREEDLHKEVAARREKGER